VVSGKDILWTISLPFRMRNTSELDIYEFINLLVFETFNSIDIEIAKKLLTLAEKKDFIELKNGKIRYIPQNLWNPVIYKLDWAPNLEGIEEVKEFKLDPLPKVSELKYIPKKVKKIVTTIESPSIETAIKEIPTKKPKAKKKKTTEAKKKSAKKVKEKKLKEAKKEIVKKEKKKKKSKKESKTKPKKVAEKKGKSLEDFF